MLSADHIAMIMGKRTVLDIDHLSIEDGEVLSIIGPNGAGKSTLLLILACLIFPTRGKVFYGDIEATKKNVLGLRRKTAVVFQSPLLLDGTALDNVMLGLKIRGKREGAPDVAEKWLDRFGVLGVSRQMTHTLSGGEAQRVALARAFALEPEVLFLDEPFSSVDAISRPGLINTVKEAQKVSGTTTLLVTHDFREVEAMAGRVVVLYDGRIQAVGTPEEIANDAAWRSLAEGSGRP